MRRLLAIILLLSVNHAGGQVALRAPTPQPTATPVPPGYRSPTELKKLPLEQLVDVQITSAAHRPEPLSQAASAVDVITDEDIHRAGVTNLPDAFRLAPAMEVAQIVRLRINSAALRNARLNVSSKLLQVADIRS